MRQLNHVLRSSKNGTEFGAVFGRGHPSRPIPLTARKVRRRRPGLSATGSVIFRAGSPRDSLPAVFRDDRSTGAPRSLEASPDPLPPKICGFVPSPYPSHVGAAFGRKNETDVVSGSMCLIQQMSTGSVNRVLIYRDGIEGVNASTRPSTTQRAKEGWITGSGGAHLPQARQVMNNSRVTPRSRQFCVFGRPHAGGSWQTSAVLGMKHPLRAPLQRYYRDVAAPDRKHTRSAASALAVNGRDALDPTRSSDHRRPRGRAGRGAAPRRLRRPCSRRSAPDLRSTRKMLDSR